MQDTLLSFSQAAKLIKMKRAGIWAAVSRGRIFAEQYGPHKLIRTSEALRYNREKRKPGRPRREE